MSALICSKCGQPNPASNEQCRACGASLHSLENYSATDRSVEAGVPAYAPSRPLEAPQLAPPSNSLAGQTVAHYAIETQLGQGGMGSVWRAVDLKLHRSVALKFLAAHFADDPKAKARFLREARTASALDHPNIGTVYEIGQHGAGLFIAMGFYEGETLAQRIARGPMPFAEVEAILAQIASGLAAAHAAGIAHRDLKPANVMLTRSGLVKILDFGLAKLLDAPEDGAPPLTQTGRVMGTVAYMSPEQAEGHVVDHRTDLWALGVVAFEMVAGQRPFVGDSAAVMLSRILVGNPRSLRELRPDVPDSLQRLIAGLLEKDPARRPQQAAEVLRDLGVSGSVPALLLPGAEAPLARPSSPDLAHQTTVPPFALTDARTEPAVAGRASRRPRALRVAASVFALALVALASSYLWKPGSNSGEPFRGMPHIAILAIQDNTDLESMHKAGVGPILSDALVQVLNDYKGVYIVSPPRLYSHAQMLGRSFADTGRDLELARQVCAKVEADLMLTGSLSKFGSSFVLSLTVTEAASERHVATVQASVQREEDLLGALPSQASEALQKQLESAYGMKMEARPGSADVTTRSLDAYTHLVRGMELELDSNWQGALAELQEAVRIDPEWAFAWASLSCVASYLGDSALSEAAGKRALEHSARANEKERLWIAASSLWSEATAEQYVKAMRDYIARYPDDRHPYLYAGFAERWLGKSCEKALAWYEQAYELTPDYYHISKELAECQAELGHKDKAVAALERFLKVGRGVGAQRAQTQLAGLK